MGDSTFVSTDPLVDNIVGLVYVHIPKNASCWIKYHLGLLSGKAYNYYDQGFDNQKHLALIVLRDPLERWISAMGQILVGYSPNHHLHIDRVDWDEITQTIYRNNHTQPQQDFFANISHDRIVWFRCDESLQHKFINFLQEHNLRVTALPQDRDSDNIFNVTAKVLGKRINNYVAPPQQVIVDKVRYVLRQHPEYVDRIKKLYAEDYKLFDSVPYYAPR